MQKDYMFTDKYRPKKITDCILPDRLKEKFQGYVDEGFVPDILLTGTSGVGKTTVARAMLDELGLDYIFINASNKRNIETLRTEIQDFASTVSFSGGRKYVILDEADNLNADSTQKALRSFMETYSNNCGFIMTCNYKNKLIPALQSRGSVIDFSITKEERKDMALKFMSRLRYILDNEKIDYEPKVLAELIKKHMPDWRRVINECQSNSLSGKIDSSILVNHLDENYKVLVGYLKNKKFNDMRKWVGENTDIDQIEVMRKIYDTSSTLLKEQAVPSIILILSKYIYQAAFAVDSEINLTACLTEIMIEDAFK